jgi:integrase
VAWVEKVSSTSWRVRYFKDDGRIGSVSGFPNKTAADRHAADMEAGQRAGTFIDPAAGRTTVAEWAVDWLPSLDVDVRTEENYECRLRCHILPRWGEVALADISGVQVASWAKQLRAGGLAPATVSGILKLFTMMLADAVYERLIAYNPVQPRRRGRGRTARPTERIWATPEEVLAVTDQAARCYDPCAAVLIVTAAWTGARWGELAGLHRNNLLLDAGRLIVDPREGALHESAGGKLWLGPPKNAGSARAIALPEFLIPLLERHLASVWSEFVFATPDGHWHRRSNFSRRAMRPAADGQDGQPCPADGHDVACRTDPVKPGLTFHGLRHSHKTWMIADGVPEIAQSRRLGHVLHDKIQETYSHVAPEVEGRLLQGLQDRWDKATANSTEPAAGISYRA